MQAIELINNKEGWFTIVLLVSFVLIALLKLLKPKQLVGYSISFFSPGFFQKKAEEFISVFTPFKLTLLAFSIIILSLVFYSSFNKLLFDSQDFQSFLKILATVFCYIFFKYIIDIFLANVLALKENVNYFLQLKYGYLFTVCLLIFPILIVNKYAIKSGYFLLFTFAILLIFRTLLILFNNKRLILGKLFYFILYFCTLEIAPLLILYKTTTT
ncbi:protein of unknown function [Tenacibaculum sp. MAR_2009_124]|uniref:DUF4271 domain-containing protein n=1 Tax=Tenacibaculum sp. MAR_2009_124 TaxID=1250059 RepID=UPI0008946C20|nr:protein of unknown function [Tenacibaculum sp. MAR_2009_124]